MEKKTDTGDRLPADDELAGKFAYWMMEHRDSLYRYVFSLHPIVDEVDDLMQDTALTLWRKIDDYDQDREFLPWALRIAYFEVLRWRKHMSRRRFVLSSETINNLSELASNEEELNRDRMEALQDCMNRLSQQHRQVVTQRYQGAGTLKELAEQLGVSAHKIYHTLDDARQALVGCVEKKLRFDPCAEERS